MDPQADIHGKFYLARVRSDNTSYDAREIESAWVFQGGSTFGYRQLEDFLTKKAKLGFRCQLLVKKMSDTEWHKWEECLKASESFLLREFASPKMTNVHAHKNHFPFEMIAWAEHLVDEKIVTDPEAVQFLDEFKNKKIKNFVDPSVLQTAFETSNKMVSSDKHEQLLAASGNPLLPGFVCPPAPEPAAFVEVIPDDVTPKDPVQDNLARMEEEVRMENEKRYGGSFKKDFHIVMYDKLVESLKKRHVDEVSSLKKLFDEKVAENSKLHADLELVTARGRVLESTLLKKMSTDIHTLVQREVDHAVKSIVKGELEVLSGVMEDGFGCIKSLVGAGTAQMVDSTEQIKIKLDSVTEEVEAIGRKNEEVKEPMKSNPNQSVCFVDNEGVNDLRNRLGKRSSSNSGIWMEGCAPPAKLGSHVVSGHQGNSALPFAKGVFETPPTTPAQGLDQGRKQGFSMPAGRERVPVFNASCPPPVIQSRTEEVQQWRVVQPMYPGVGGQQVSRGLGQVYPWGQEQGRKEEQGGASRRLEYGQ